MQYFFPKKLFILNSKFLFLILSFVCLLFVTVKPSYASISLDTTFGNGGKAITSFSNDASVNSIGIQSDGKTLVAGYNSNGGHRNWAVGRFNINGTLDNNFGLNGIITQDFGYDIVVHALSIQNDQKIIIAGSDAAGNGVRVWTIGRYNSNGSIDVNFGNNGIVASPIGDDLFEILTGLALQSDGKIIATGYLRKNGSNTEYAVLVRYNSDGSYDQNFGTGGIVTTTFTTFERVHAISLQADGKIVIAGDYSNGVFVRRFNADGSIDTTFGNNGLLTDFNGIPSSLVALAIQPDGKIVVGGRMSDAFLIRYNSNGTRDSSFGSGGVVANPFGVNGVQDSVNSLKVQSDGKILFAGGDGTNSAIGRLNIDGSIDTTFGNNGLLSTPLGVTSSFNSLLLQPDGKIVAAGSASNGTNNDWELARYVNTSPILNVPLLKQTASPWGNQVYDGANFWSPGYKTITDWGCALTSYAMILEYYGINKLPDGTLLDPGTLNTWLKNNNGYDDGINNGYIIPTALSKLSKLAKTVNNISTFDALETKVISGFNQSQLITDLNNSQPDMLGVSGNSHYVVAKGIDGNTFAINDPYFNRTSLNDGYGNTFASLIEYKPSFTDLSYIFITATSNVQLTLKDSQNNSVGEQFIQNPLNNEITGLPSGQSSQILSFQNPTNGDYNLTISGTSNQSYKINAYIYDKDGNTQKITQQGTVSSSNPDTISINFDSQNTSNTSVSRLVTFQSTINDIIENKNLNQINKFSADALLALVNSAKRESENGKKINAKLTLNASIFLLNVVRNRGISESAYQILIYDINFLKSHL